MTSLTSKRSLVLAILTPLWLVSGCSKSGPGGSGAIPEAARKEAAEIFSTRCMTCHGATGRGDGPASAGLTPKPRNFHDPAWQSSATDIHIETIIQFGGGSVGKSPAMPGNPDLVSKLEVVSALRAHIRNLGK